MYTDTLLNIKVSVMDNTGLLLESTNGPYLIQLVLFTVAGGTTYASAYTINGLAFFSNIQILTPGTYWVQAFSANCISAITSTFTVQWGAITDIVLQTPGYVIDAKYLFPIDIGLYNSTGQLIPYAAYTKVVCDGIVIAENQAIGGIANLSVFFNVSGESKVFICAGSVTTVLEISVFPSNNSDPACLIAESEDNCIVCAGEAAQIVNGICECILNSVYNRTANECQCINGLTASNNYCIVCGNYFDTIEVDAYYLQDYFGIAVRFRRQVNTTHLLTCFDILLMDAYLLGLDLECIWEDNNTLSVYMNSYPYLNHSSININSIAVQAIGTICNFNIYQLSIPILQKWKPPIPTCEIDGPDSYFLGCADDPLIFQAVSVDSYSTYSWASQFSTTPSLSSLISSSASPSLVLPSSLLFPQTLALSLSMSYPSLGTSCTSTKSTFLSLSTAIQVSFAGTSSISVPSDSAYTLQAQVPRFCYLSPLTYTWSSSVPGPSLQEFVDASLRPGILLIPGGSLQPGTYFFTVSVSNAQASGSAAASITVLKSELQVTMSRSSGAVGVFEDLEVTALAVDPDDLYANVLYSWNCEMNLYPCLDNSGGILAFSEKQRGFLVKKDLLRSQATYQISVTASTLLKSFSTEIEIYIDPEIQGDIQIAFPLYKISSDSGVIIYPTVTSLAAPEFLWEITAGGEPMRFLSKYPFLSLQNSVLEPGSEYILSLTAVYPDMNSALWASGVVSTNAPAICSGVEGTAIDLKWQVIAKDCFDGDNSDYPLYYQFGNVAIDGKVTLLSPISSNLLFIGYLPGSTHWVYARVCDSLDGCTEYRQAVTINRRRNQESSLALETLLGDIEAVPNIVLVLAQLNISNTTYALMWNRTSDYFSTEIMNLYNYQLFLDCFQALVLLSSYNTKNLLQSQIELLGNLTQRYNERLLDEDIATIFCALSPYLTTVPPSTLTEIILLLSRNWIINTTAGTKKQFTNDGLGLIAYRMIGEEMSGLNIALDSISIAFPSGSLNSSALYDIFISVTYSDNSSFINLNIEQIGFYNSYSLVFTENINSSIAGPVVISIPNRFRYSNVICESIELEIKGQCGVNYVNMQEISLTMHSSSNFTVQDLVIVCKTVKSTVSFLIVFVIFTLVACEAVISKDTSAMQIENQTNTFLEMYCLSSCFIPQTYPKRLLKVVHCFTDLIVLLASIKTLHQYFPYYSTSTTDIPGQYSKEDLILGLISLGFSQIFTIPSYLIYWFQSKQTNWYIFFTSIFGGIYLSLLVFMIYSSTTYCHEDHSSWIVSFFICGFLGFFVLHPCYAWISVKVWRYRNYQRERPGVTGVPEEIAALHLNSISDQNIETHVNKIQRKETDLESFWKK